MRRAWIPVFVWFSAGSLLSTSASGSIIATGYVIYNVTNPGISAEFDIVNQTGPNSTNDSTWPVITPVSLLNLSLTVDFSSGLPIVFGPSYFTLSVDGLSFDGSTIAIDGTNPQPVGATLTGTFSPTAVTLFNAATETLDPAFAASIVPSSGTILQDQDLALVNGISAVPEPATSVLLLIGVGVLLICRARRRNRPMAVSLACLLAILCASWAASASTAIKLNLSTVPGTGVAGVTRVSVTGSGFSNAAIAPANVTVSLAASCGGSVSAATTALSVKTVVGSSSVIQFQIPATLAQNTYFVSVSGTDSAGVTFASSNCSQIAVTTDTTITECREITTPGSYSLAGNLVQPPVSTQDTACLAIHDANNVQLDCRSNTITASPGGIYGVPVSITNVQNFSIRNCTLEARGSLLLATSSSNGVIDGNTFGNLTDQRIVDVQFILVNNSIFSNNILNASFIQRRSSGNTLRFNTATCPVWTNGLACAGVFISTYGWNNTFDSNQIDGKSGPQPSQNALGADDGIVIQDETGDVLANNVIKNAWDAGIETAGNIVNTRIANNSIANVPIGIGGWYWNSWTNVSVTNNIVDRAHQLFVFYRYYGLRPANWWDGVAYEAPADMGVYFQGNLFSGNQLLNGYPADQSSSIIPIYEHLFYFNLKTAVDLAP